MGLRVWLPLNGSLENQGLSTLSITNSGATVDTAGKIGSCYAFDGNDDYISLTGQCFYDVIKGGTQPFSIAMWVYHADATRAILFGDYNLSGAINFNIELTTSHTLRFYWGASPDTTISTASVGLSTWGHVVIVYDGSSLKFYINGDLKNTWSGTLATKTKTSGAYYLGRDSRTGATVLNGRLNDFRLYDHALSVKEVRELARGLIVHYKLDKLNGTKIADCSGFKNHGTILNNVTVDSNTTPRYSNSIKFNATNAKVQLPSINYANFGNSFTFSWWQYNTGTSNMPWGFSNGNRLNLYHSTPLCWNTGDGTSNQIKDGNTTISPTSLQNAWHHMVMTGNGTDGKLYIDGVYRGKATTYKGLTGTQIYLSGWDTGTNYTFNGSRLVDFRIYNTVLTDKQILELYNESAAIARDGTTFAREFVEATL